MPVPITDPCNSPPFSVRLHELESGVKVATLTFEVLYNLNSSPYKLSPIERLSPDELPILTSLEAAVPKLVEVVVLAGSVVNANVPFPDGSI